MKLFGLELPQVMADALRACRPHLMAALGFSFFLNLLFLAPALYMLQVYDRVVATAGRTTLLFVTLALLIALVTLAALDAIRARLLIRASARLDAELSPKIVQRMMSEGGQDSSQALRDFDTVRQTLASPVTGAILDAPWAPIFIIVAFLLHFWIGAFALLSVVLLVVIATMNQRATRASVDASSRELAASAASGQAAALQGPTIRALGMTSAMANRQLQQRSSGLGSLAESQFVGSRFSALTRFVRLFVQSAALGIGALLAIAGEISAGAIIAASILLGRALQPVEGLVGGWATLSSARAALARLSATLARDADAERPRTQLPKPDGRLDVEGVGVRSAPGAPPIIVDITFQAVPGDLIGIIGPSGSGKTTLAKVIAGAVVPQAGNVRIDGAQRADWDADFLGRCIGYLPQEPSLFEGSIKDNISRFDAADADSAEVDAAVIASAKLTGVHQLILRLPQGYDTQLGPMGAGLSSGQAQRIALARAFYGRPNLLVLDEPNAFLDAEGETALIRALLAERKRGATIIVIAHRRAVIEAANKLMVIEGGRMKMFGPAREVIARLSAPSTAESAA